MRMDIIYGTDDKILYTARPLLKRLSVADKD